MVEAKVKPACKPDQVETEAQTLRGEHDDQAQAHADGGFFHHAADHHRRMRVLRRDRAWATA